MNSIMAYFHLCFIILCLNGCEKLLQPRFSFQILNDSGITISTFIALESDAGFVYPDTLLPIDSIPMQTSKPGQSNYYDFDISIGKFFELLPRDTFSVFYFSTDSLNKYTWIKIRENSMILRRDDLSKDDIENSNFIIRYP